MGKVFDKIFADFDRNGRPLRHQKHSKTSLDAADLILPGVNTLRRKVYDFIKDRGSRGATDEEMQLEMPIPPSTQRPRRVELLEASLIKDSGERRKTRSGRDAVVWLVKSQSG